MTPHRTEFTCTVKTRNRTIERIKNLTEFISARTALCVQDCRIKLSSIVRTFTDGTGDDRGFAAFKCDFAFLFQRTAEIFIGSGFDVCIPAFNCSN